MITTNIKKYNVSIISLVLALLCIFACVFTSYTNTKNSIDFTTRTIEVTRQELDFQSAFQGFENSKLETNENITTFEGERSFNLADFIEIDLVSEDIIDDNADMQVKVKYHYEYNSEENIIILTAKLIDVNGTEIIDQMVGVPYVNNEGNLDCVFDCDGELVLLSELQNADMIENCGWFKKLCKKVASAVKKVVKTTVGKVGAALTVAVPAVIGVVCAVAAMPVAATVGIGLIAGAGIAASTAAASTYQQDGKVDWETVGICAGVGAAVGAVTSYASYKITNAIKSLFPKAKTSTTINKFDSNSKFINHYGKASDYIKDGEWHHIVEQQTVKNGINSASSVYNSQNTVAISKNLHHKISGYYSRIYRDGLTFRQYINTLTYEEQYIKGLEVLKMFAEQLGETIIWL